jgi:hypothetical protein
LDFAKLLILTLMLKYQKHCIDDGVQQKIRNDQY